MNTENKQSAKLDAVAVQACREHWRVYDRAIPMPEGSALRIAPATVSVEAVQGESVVQLSVGAWHETAISTGRTVFLTVPTARRVALALLRAAGAHEAACEAGVHVARAEYREQLPDEEGAAS